MYDVPNYTIEDLVDGMISFLRTNLVAYTPLVRDAHKGDTVIYVDNNLRFDRFKQIVIMDNNSTYNSDQQEFYGIEFHTVAEDHPYDSNSIVLDRPLGKDYLVADHGRIQLALHNALLYEKDILYGDRAVIAFDQVAICVEPESNSNEWLALQGLLGNEYRFSIIVYVKAGGLGEAEESAMRIANAYSDNIKHLLNSNIHLDLCIDQVPLVRDACPGQRSVFISAKYKDQWPPDRCKNYEVQDNFNAHQMLYLVHEHSSSSTDSSCISCGCSETSSASSVSSSSTTSANSSFSSASSLNSSSFSSRSSVSSASSSSSSESSATISSSSSLSESSSPSSAFYIVSSSSSSSSLEGQAYEVFLSAKLLSHFRVRDKAVLRRKKRFMYDSRVDSVEYGTVQKGSVFLKAARLSWFGKETEQFSFPQVNRGLPKGKTS